MNCCSEIVKSATTILISPQCFNFVLAEEQFAALLTFYSFNVEEKILRAKIVCTVLYIFSKLLWHKRESFPFRWFD